MKKQIQNKIYGKKYAIGIAIALIVVFAFLMFNPNSGVLVKKTYTNNENFEVSRLSTVESDIIEYSFSAIESEKYYKGIYSTKVYTYDGGTPGPTIRAKVGDLVKVTLLNELDVPTTIHWHGIQLENEFDGVPGVTQDEIKPGETFTYEFVAQNAGTFWYHPHFNTHEQVEMGLYGAVIIEDDLDIEYDSDNIIFLDDVRLDSSSQITGFTPTSSVMHGRFGNVFLINGEVNSEFNFKKGEIVRLRFINAANARTFYMGIEGAKFLVIGRDIGAMEKPYETRTIQIAPGERFDVLVYFEGDAESYKLVNYKRDGYDLLSTFNTVKESWSKKKNALEYEEIKSRTLATFPDFSEYDEMEPNVTFNLEGIVIIEDGVKKLEWTINKKVHPKNTQVDTLTLGEVYKFRYTNLQAQSHPMHLHGQKFLITHRNGVAVTNKVWMDTVNVGNRETIDVVFIAEGRGSWVNHCHILEHAKAGMLSVVVVE